MILKELDPFYPGSADELAARISADRMAYYLRRFFRRSTEVDVLHALVIPGDNTTARIDHLLLHEHGLIVVQREAVEGQVQIDADGQWTRWEDSRPVPMGSPITRAYLQALLLKQYLDLRVRQKGFFDLLEFDVLVVVSDACEVQWPRTGHLQEVCTREEVYERVIWRKELCRSGAARPGILPAAERRILAEFLRRSHLGQSHFTRR